VISPVAGADGDAEAFAEQQAIAFVKAMFPLLEHYLPA
jgi:hypothetical protein